MCILMCMFNGMFLLFFMHVNVYCLTGFLRILFVWLSMYIIHQLVCIHHVNFTVESIGTFRCEDFLFFHSHFGWRIQNIAGVYRALFAPVFQWLNKIIPICPIELPPLSHGRPSPFPTPPPTPCSTCGFKMKPSSHPYFVQWTVPNSDSLFTKLLHTYQFLNDSANTCK